MALPENLVKEFAELTNDTAPIDKETRLYGTIKMVSESGIDVPYVQLDGADEGILTPVVSTVDVSQGDKVAVSIKSHSAVVTGNLTDPSAKTSVVGDINGKYSEISQSLDEIRSVIFGEDGSYSTLVQTVDSLKSEIYDSDGKFSKLEQTVDGITVTTSSGETKINGSCIETGTINFNALDTDTQEKVDNAESNASNAYNYASAANNTLSAWTYGSTTLIDGSKIMTGTVKASNLYGGTVNLLAQDTDSYGNPIEVTVGGLHLAPASSSDYGVQLGSGGALRFQAQNGSVFLQSCKRDAYNNILQGPYLQLSYNDWDISVGSGNFRPGSDGSFTCGTSSFRWSAIYASTPTIVTSDKNHKNSIEVLPDKYLMMMDAVEAKRFKLNDGTSGRYHVGFIAQDIEKAMSASGITSAEFAGWIKDKDADGNEIYMLRYEEFIGILWAKIKQLESRISDMEA